MFIQESELFKELDEKTATEIAKIMVQETYEKGSVVYDQSGHAEHFFILWEGKVQLSMGAEAEIDYLVNRRGEVFGWSSLMDREHYSTRAECLERSKIYRIDKQQMESILKKYPYTGMIFYKKLAGAVLKRLLYMYEESLRQSSLRGITSFGTRQVMAVGED